MWGDGWNGVEWIPLWLLWLLEGVFSLVSPRKVLSMELVPPNSEKWPFIQKSMETGPNKLCIKPVLPLFSQFFSSLATFATLWASQSLTSICLSMHDLVYFQTANNFWLECTSDLKWAFPNCILITLFRDTPLAHLSCHLTQSTWHLKIQVPAPGTSPKPGKWGIPEKGYQNAVQKCLFQVASALQSNVMAQTWLG